MNYVVNKIKKSNLIKVALYHCFKPLTYYLATTTFLTVVFASEVTTLTK